MSPNFSRTLATTAVVAGLSGCAAVPAEHHWVKVKPAHATAQAELSGVDGDYAAAVAAIDRRDYGLALDLLQTANARKGGDVRVLNAFGVVYDKLGRFDLSSRYYARARTIDANSPIVASNQAYSAILQGDVAHAPMAAPRVLASAAPQASAGVPAAVELSPVPMAEAPHAAPVYLAAAPDVAMPARLYPAPLAQAPHEPDLAVAASRLVRSVASSSLLQSLARYLAPTPGPEQGASILASTIHVTFEPRHADVAPPASLAQAGPPIVLRPVAQRGVVRLAAISPGAVPTLPARRRGLEIADASGRPGAAAPIRLQLAQLGWTTQRGPIATAPRISRTTITYAAYRAPVALSLARTLPRGVRLVDCGNACGGIRLTLGSDALAWPSRIHAALKAFG